ncbi:ATPase, T2SS/T4P/T4SS family [Trinickia sp. LjRoot230]
MAPAAIAAASAPADASEVPVVRLLADVLAQASQLRASDIHVEPGDASWRIRLRIDGVLHELLRPPAYLRDAFVTRLKVLARLDIAERRVPQDGRLRLAVAPGVIENYRVSSLPTLLGEKLVLRRLEALPADLSLGTLGFDSGQRLLIEAALNAPHGLILVTGPTGSGKTLSLYCFLQMLNASSRNLCTVEDPAEIQLPDINQVNVREQTGLTFATALRAFLRQDPDVVMVGEIRDAETADVALKAAQTGHLVLSTLHTNDAPGAITRLIDIGIARYRLAAALRLVTAQRLVRRLCERCRESGHESPAALHAAGFAMHEIGGWTPYVARGCEACHGIGYLGRVGVHQVLNVSAAMRELIVGGASCIELARRAQLDGAISLRRAALARVRDGTTTLAEVVSSTEAV